MLAIVFPGQGSQKMGMGKDFFDTYPIARQVFAEANDLLGWNVSNLCFYGSDLELAQTRSTQVAVFVVEMAILKSIQNEGLIHSSFFAGHSLGEYSALVASGALSFSEGLRIVSKRGQLMEEACQVGHGMLAVSGISLSKVAVLCEEFNVAGLAMDFACYNGPEQCVLAGEILVLSKAVEVLSGWGAKTARLKVSGAFHSRWMQIKSHVFSDELRNISWGEMRHPVISNVSGEPYPEDRMKWIELLSKQLYQPVNWLKTVRFLYLRGVRRFLEIGPGNLLAQLNHLIMPSIEIYSISSLPDVKNGLEFTSKTSPSSIGLAFIARALAYATATRNSESIQSKFEEECRKPYLEILNLYNTAKENSQGGSAIACRRAAEMLQSIFTRKCVPQEEQNLRWRELSWIDSFNVLKKEAQDSTVLI
jgi:[acyl-carrier-protein] S-malonyltransferase